MRLLCLASQAGVNFERTLTLGRQSLHCNQADLERAMGECGVSFEPSILQADGYSESFLRSLGAASLQAMDASTYEGADIIHDLNVSVPQSLHGAFSLVFDGGSLEHVFNFPTGIANAMQMVEIGGHFIGITVCNNYVGHGFYQFSPELFYRVFAPENGFRVRGVFVLETKSSGMDDGVFYQAVDPAELNRRVLLRNHAETLIAVWAQRLADVPLFQSPPQQSDYVEAWDSKTGNAHRASRRGLAARTRPLRYAAKRGLSRALPRLPQSAPRYDSGGFRRMVMNRAALELLRSL